MPENIVPEVPADDTKDEKKGENLPTNDLKEGETAKKKNGGILKPSRTFEEKKGVKFDVQKNDKKEVGATEENSQNNSSEDEIHDVDAKQSSDVNERTPLVSGKANETTFCKIITRIASPLMLANGALNAAQLAANYVKNFHDAYQNGCAQAKSDAFGSGQYNNPAHSGDYNLAGSIVEGITVGVGTAATAYAAAHAIPNAKSVKSKLALTALGLIAIGVNVIEFLTLWHTAGVDPGEWQGYDTCWQVYCQQVPGHGCPTNDQISLEANDHTGAGNLFSHASSALKAGIGGGLAVLLAGKGFYDGWKQHKETQQSTANVEQPSKRNTIQ